VDRRGPALTLRPRRDTNRLPWPLVAGLTAIPVGFLAVFYAWPFLTLLGRGLSPGAVADTLGDAETWRIAWFTLWQALASTALTIVIGLAPAYVFARYAFPGRRLLGALLAAAFVLPTVVMGAAVLALLPDGWDRGVPAILLAHVIFNLAVVVRTVGATWAHLPPDLDAAAATLGASPWRTFRHVTLPLLRPAVLAAAAIVFVFTFTSFGVIRILGRAGTSTIEVEVWRQATQLGDVGAAATLAVLQLSAIGAGVAWAAWQQRRHSRALALRPLARRRRTRRGRERALVTVVAVATGLLVLAPLAALVERSFRGSGGAHTLTAWRTLGGSEIRPGISAGIDPLGSVGTSLRTTAAATAIAVVVGVVASLAITAARRGGRLLDTSLMLPIATSAVTIGFGVLITFDRPPVDWRASWWIVPIGQALVAVPFVVRTVLPVLRGIDPHLQEAAATLGAAPARAWRTVVVPYLRRPVAAAAGLAAAISLGEFGATSFLSRSGTPTMPIAIGQLLGRAGAVLQAQGFALATILAATTVVVVVALDVAGDR
jgi:thiamine transport system permease protein